MAQKHDNTGDVSNIIKEVKNSKTIEKKAIFESFSPLPDLKKNKQAVNLFEFSKMFVNNILDRAQKEKFIKLVRGSRTFADLPSLIDDYLNVRNVEKPYTFKKILEETLQSFATSSAKRRAIDFIGNRKELEKELLDYDIEKLIKIKESGIAKNLKKVLKCKDDVITRAAKCLYSQTIVLNTFDKAEKYIDYLDDKNFKSNHRGRSFIEYNKYPGKKYSFDAPESASKLEIQNEYCAIYGFGEAIASNFMKEIGFDYGKPDTHLLYVMYKIGLTPSDKNLADCQKAIIDQAKKCGCTSYALDKIIWLCCTAFFYRDRNEHYLNASHYRIREVFVSELNKAIKSGLVIL